MSYDLMVFEKTEAPNIKPAFMKWYEQQVSWGEDHNYDSISVSSPALRAWFMEMRESFPPMNGEFSLEPDEWDDFESRSGDYSIGRHMIYAGFAWSVAEQAHDLALKLARKHDLGFFDAGGSGEIVFPGGTEPEASPKPRFGWFRRRK